MNAIAPTIAALQLAPAQSYRNLSVYPLLAAQPAPQGYLTLDEALERKLACITELTQGGVVPELRFDNLSDQRILLLDGEELVGAKQNRVLNLSILVPAGAQIVIPVSCVERGRWHYLSHEFRSAKRQMYAKARAAKMVQVSMSLHTTGTRHSNQAAVWADIATKSTRLGSHSATEAMAAMYEQEHDRLEGFERGFHTVDRQVGAVFALNGRVVGVEVFDSAQAFGKLFNKLVGSYALDAIDEPLTEEVAATEQVVAEFLFRIQAAAIERFPAIGEGEDLRLHGQGVLGSALLAEGRIIHLTAFSQ